MPAHSGTTGCRNSQGHANDARALAVCPALLHPERGRLDRQARPDEVERVGADDAADAGERTGQQAPRRVDGAVL